MQAFARRTAFLSRSSARPVVASRVLAPSSLLQTRLASSAHAEESFEEFTTRYTNFFQNCQDIFELQRGLNNCFAYDLVPAPSILEAALKAARRVDDFSTAVRVFEGLKEKVENKSQYDAYLAELKGIREELGVVTKEELYDL